MTGQSKVMVVTSITNNKGEKGVVLNIMIPVGYVSVFINKDEMLGLYHDLANSLMAMEPPTTDNHIT